jgi:AraC-like DNA-binding protein
VARGGRPAAARAATIPGHEDLQEKPMGTASAATARSIVLVHGGFVDGSGWQGMQARVDVATRMLRSPLFDRVTTAEIGRRAGFSDASHFARVLRKRTGQTPLQVRKAR